MITGKEIKSRRKWAEEKRRVVGKPIQTIFHGKGGMQISMWHKNQTVEDPNVSIFD